jgi:hypothetical protein
MPSSFPANAIMSLSSRSDTFCKLCAACESRVIGSSVRRTIRRSSNVCDIRINVSSVPVRSASPIAKANINRPILITTSYVAPLWLTCCT